MRLVGEFSDVPCALPLPCDCDRLRRLLIVRENQADRYRRELYRQERELAALRRERYQQEGELATLRRWIREAATEEAS